KDVAALQRDLGLPTGLTEPDASLLGDGSFRPAPVTDDRPAARRDDRRGGRPADVGDRAPRGDKPRRRNANLYAPGDPRLERSERGDATGRRPERPAGQTRHRSGKPGGPKPAGGKVHRKGGGAKKQARRGAPR